MTYLKVFTDFRELMEPLSAEEKGRLFEAMLAYAMDGAEVALEGNERFVWPVARRQIDQEAAAYELKVNSASKARASRWKRSSEPREDALVSEPTALISDKEQEQDQEQKEDQYQDHSQEYVYEQEQPPRTDTHIPEREEIEAYCRERKNGIDPDYFYNYYKATGWQVGQHPIRDWKALIQAWEKRDAQRLNSPGPLSDTVQSILNMAQAKRRDRQRNTLLNYNETPPDPPIQEIVLDLDEL